jgi:outer membrane biosynthesis protein TonB
MPSVRTPLLPTRLGGGAAPVLTPAARRPRGPRRRAALLALALVALALLAAQALGGLLAPAASAAPVAYFGTLPPGSALPSEADCAARVRRHGWEPVPANAARNGAVNIRVPRLTADPENRRPDFAQRVSGGFAGTTDELRQFYACKWGLDEVHLGAVMHYESEWRQAMLGDFRPLTNPDGTRNAACQPGYLTDPCPESFGITQVRVTFYPGTAPGAIASTSFNLDYYGASQRACFEGLTTWLRTAPRGQEYGPGNLLGCAGWWYNGGSWMLEETSGTYRRNVQARITNPPWHAWAGWPGYAAGAPAPQPPTPAPPAPTVPATATRPPTPGQSAPPASVPTATPPPPVAAPPTAGAGELLIYDDAPGAGFWDGSYGYAARTPCDAAARASAGCAYAIALNPWGALNFGKEGGFATAGQTHLEFALHTHGQALSALAVLLKAYPGGQSLGEVRLAQAHVTATLADGWVRVAVPVAQLNPGNATAYTVQVQNGTASPLATIHVDALRFVASAAPPPASTPTTTPPPTATMVPTTTATPTATSTPSATPTRTPTRTPTPSGAPRPTEPSRPTKTPRPRAVPAKTFPDVAADTPEGTAISELTARGIISGYADGRFGPQDSVLRAQMAGLIARAVGWEGEDHGNPFTDRAGLDADLWRNVGTLAHRGVAKGYGNGTFGPSRRVTRAETIAFITRAMVADGHWAYPDNAPDNADSGSHARDIATYLAYVGALPEGSGDLDRPATRGWFAVALWAALQTTDLAP